MPAAETPAAIYETRGNRKRLAVLNAKARQRGLVSGMSLPSALSLVPELLARTRQLATERQALAAAATWAYHYGAPVTLSTTQLCLWVEVGNSLRLFGGWKPLAQALLTADPALPYRRQLGVAPTQACAWLLAQASVQPRRPITQVSAIPAAIGALPLRLLPLAEEAIVLLEGAGLSRIAEVLALPAADLGKRLGADALLALDRLLGRVPETWESWRPPATYRRRFEFQEPIETTEALLFPLKMMLNEFVRYLKLRDVSIQHFRLRLVDSRKRVLRQPIGLLSPTRDPARLLLVLRERLDRLHLEDGVVEVAIEAGRFEAASASQDDLFGNAASLGERLTELRERLIARLGTEAVKTLAVSPDQRPEHALTTPDQPTTSGQHHPARPLWLLPQPRPLRPRRLLSSAERIELGWWDGDERARDYHLAEDSDGRLCWVFREPRKPDDWQLHGLWQ